LKNFLTIYLNCYYVYRRRNVNGKDVFGESFDEGESYAAAQEAEGLSNDEKDTNTSVGATYVHQLSGDHSPPNASDVAAVPYEFGSWDYSYYSDKNLNLTLNKVLPGFSFTLTAASAQVYEEK
jgi:hypothetical protein